MFAKGVMVVKKSDIGTPVIMLAQFFAHNDVPRPRKFKYVDDQDNVEIVIVDEVVKIRTGSSTYISYDCISHYENYSKKYHLIYFFQRHSWEMCPDGSIFRY